MAKLNYQYGTAYWTDLHPGDIIPTGAGEYIIVTQDMIDSDGTFKQTSYTSDKILNNQYLEGDKLDQLKGD